MSKKSAHSSEAIQARKAKSEVRLAKQTAAADLAFIRESVKPENKNQWIYEPVAKYVKKLLEAGSVVPAPPVTPPPVASHGSPSSGSGGAITDGGSGSVPEQRQPAPPPPGSKAEKEAAENAKMRAKEVVHQYGKIISLGVGDLKWLLTSIEPISCSNEALRALATRGAQQVSKAALCQMIEFCTGVAGSDALHGVWETLGSLSDHLKGENMKRQRPCTWRLLSAEWPEDGVYCFLLSEDGLVVKNRTTEIQVTVPFSVLQAYKLSVPYDKLTIINNWSDKDACVVQTGTPGKLPLMAVMGLMMAPIGGVSGGRPVAKKPRMIENVVEQPMGPASVPFAVEDKDANAGQHVQPAPVPIGEEPAEALAAAAAAELQDASGADPDEEDSSPPSPPASPEQAE